MLGEGFVKNEPNRLFTADGSIVGLLPQRKNINVRLGKNLSDGADTEAELLKSAVLSRNVYSIYKADIPKSNIHM